MSSQTVGLLLSSPLPPSTVKYPFAQLRKSLRLLIDDNPEALDEVENDISYTYSGYAPISVRLVQCIAQKGGVLSNPAERERHTEGPQDQQMNNRVQAHPIVGWKGFEDVVSVIPGQTVDLVQRGLSGNEPPSMPLCTRSPPWI